MVLQRKLRNQEKALQKAGIEVSSRSKDLPIISKDNNSNSHLCRARVTKEPAAGNATNIRSWRRAARTFSSKHISTKMGSSQSITVVHSSKVQEDREALVAILPGRFVVEPQQNSDAVLLVDGQATLVLVPCAQPKGTYATLVLEEEMLRQLSDRATTYGIKTQEEVLLDNTIVKMSMPGGSMLVVTTSDLWRSADTRSSTIDYFLSHSSTVTEPGNRNVRQPGTMAADRSGLPRDIMRRSTSMPVILPRHIDKARAPRNRLFPALQVSVMSSGDGFAEFPLNSQAPIPVESDLFVGHMLLIMRPADAKDDPYWNERIFSKKKRRFVLQLQGKLKYKPKGVVNAGMEISDPMKLGLLASGICGVILKLLGNYNSEIDYSFGEPGVRPHICFPASTFFERLVVTPPGQDVPKMGEEFQESKSSIKQRKAYKAKIDWNTEDTYSMSFHSMYTDFPTWSLVNLPFGKDLSLQTFWGNSFASIVLYETQQQTANDQLAVANRYILAVKMEYVGEESEKHIVAEDTSSDEEWAEDAPVQAETSTVSTFEDMAFLPPRDELTEHGEEPEEDLEFFDSVQSQSAIQDTILTEHVEITTSTTCFTALRMIDECCPCTVDMYSKRGKYTSVFAFPGKQSGRRPIFRTWDTAVQHFGDRLLTEAIITRFSPRMSPVERSRRILGLRYGEARIGKASPKKMSEFHNLQSAFDKTFLRRVLPSSSNMQGLRTTLVARALSDRHWREEWGQITETGVTFYRMDKQKPSVRLSLSNIVNVCCVPDSAKPLLQRYSFLAIETFGRTVYVMFHTKDECDDWLKTLERLSKKSLRLENNPIASTNPPINVDDPVEEFLLTSTMWDCQKRRILNCRRLSFRAPGSQSQPDPLLLAETALVKAMSLRPNQPNDKDLQDFLDSTSALKDADAYSLGDDERLAFFLNVYHLMIMHAFIVLGPPDSVFKWATYFNTVAYQCSDDIFSLAELEHNIIRSKSKFPSQFLSRFVLPKSQYGYNVAEGDFRLNFALNCGTLSTPTSAVPLYKAETIEQTLDAVTRTFLDKTVQVAMKGTRDVSLTLPRVCKWFEDDFGDGSTNDIIQKLYPYLDEKKQKALKVVWNEKKEQYDFGLFNVRYHPYNFECRFLTLDEEQVGICELKCNNRQ